MADGDAAVLDLARSIASSLKWCDLVVVNDGREAARYLQNEKFDGVVVADRLPVVDGFELIERLKHSSLNASIPIVMVTGEEDDIGTMRRGFRAGVTFFAVRPPNRERFYRLLNAVRGAMENERRRHNRLPYHTTVNCSIGDQGQIRFAAESIEISEGGMSLRPSGGAEKGQVLELEFLFPRFHGAPIYLLKPANRFLSRPTSLWTGHKRCAAPFATLLPRAKAWESTSWA